MENNLSEPLLKENINIINNMEYIQITKLIKNGYDNSYKYFYFIKKNNKYLFCVKINNKYITLFNSKKTIFGYKIYKKDKYINTIKKILLILVYFLILIKNLLI